MAIKDEEDVGKILMQFAAPTVLPKGQHRVVVRIFLERLAGRAVTLRSKFLEMFRPFQ